MIMSARLTLSSTNSISKLFAFLFLAGALISVVPQVGPPLSLALGLTLGLTCANPFRNQTRQLTKTLLQGSVVALGFGFRRPDGGGDYRAVGFRRYPMRKGS